MSNPSRIDFIVAGGSTLGLGHIMRSAAIAEAAIRRGHRVRVFLTGDGEDECALAAWRIASPSTPRSQILPWPAYPAGHQGAVALLDFPDEKAAWIRRLAKNHVRSLVLDDPRSVELADLTINPALHHGPAEAISQSPSEGVPRLLAGPAYSVLAGAHRLTPHQDWSDRRNLLLSLGGADPHQATPKLAPWISEALAAAEQNAPQGTPRLDRHVVLGGAFEDPRNRTRDSLREAGWKVHNALSPVQMAEMMASARIAVMGFGTSLTELAWHGTPHLSVTHHRFDLRYAKLLEDRGVGRHLGFGGDLHRDPAKAILEQTFRDPAWQSESAQRARKMLQGGNGIDRILDEVEALIDRPMGSEIRREYRQGHAAPRT